MEVLKHRKQYIENNTDEKKRIQYFWNINYEKKMTLESNKQVSHHGKLHMSCLTKLEFLFH